MDLTALLLALSIIGLGACSQGTEAPTKESLGAIQGPGALLPLVLSPRHRILSPWPPIHVVVPGDLEGTFAEITLVTSKGRTKTWRTRERSLSWPEGWGPLEVGESGWVSLRVRGQATTAGFVRAAIPRGMTLPSGAPWAWELSELGLPMEALTLIAIDPEGPGAPTTQSLASRVGLPAVVLWRRP